MKLQVDVLPKYTIAEETVANEKLVRLSTEIQEQRNEHRIRKDQLESCDTKPLKKSKRYHRVRWFLALVILTDMLLSGSAISNALGDMEIVAYIIGLCVSIAIFLFAEHFRSLVELGKNLIQRRIIILSCVIFWSVVFYAIGILREKGFAGSTFNGTVGTTAEIFMGLQLLILGVTVLVLWFMRPTKRERAIIDTYKTRKEEVRVLVKSIDELNLEVDEIKVEQAERNVAREQIQNYATYLRDIIQAHWEESRSAFTAENLQYRIDGENVAFFNETPEQLPKIQIEFNSNYSYENNGNMVVTTRPIGFVQ